MNNLEKPLDTGWPSLVREFTVDFIAILLPGFAFTIAICASIFLPLWQLFAVVGDDTMTRGEFIDILDKVSSNFYLEILLMLMAFSYIMGHIFYRRDIQDPDARSTIVDGEKGPDGAVWRLKPMTEDLIHNTRKFRRKKKQFMKLVKKEDYGYIHYPYPRLGAYLRQRNLNYLAELIYWDENDKENKHECIFRESGGEFDEKVLREVRNARKITSEGHFKKSKSFINMLKMRVAFYAPQFSQMMMRTEAHIRIMSSSWYASKAVWKISLVGCFLGILVNLVPLWNLIALLEAHLCADHIVRNADGTIYQVIWMGDDLLNTRYAESANKAHGDEMIFKPSSVMIPILFFSLGFIMQKRVEGFLHYQRLREIVHLLEIVHLISRKHPNILEGLLPPDHPRWKAAAGSFWPPASSG